MVRFFGTISTLVCICVSATAQTIDPAEPINNPDKFNWQQFVIINKNAGIAAHPSDSVWETWASDADTFPNPASMPSGAKPVWPDPNAACTKTLHPSFQRILSKRSEGTITPDLLPVDINGGEEVRRNKDTFDFIINSGYWTRDGLKKAFANGTIISAPITSIEIKANWVPANDGDESNFHVNTDCQNKKFKLVALHLITKALPNWTWATFEHVDNVGRCDFIGCRDSFGSQTTLTPPNREPSGNKSLILGKTYGASATCDKTPALLKLFSDAGLDAKVWSNYCLKGSQVDFATAAGEPIRLGNSITEAGFVSTSSCMTCHVRASVNGEGKNQLSPGGFLALGQAAGETDTGAIGYPDPNWFRYSNEAGTRFLMQTDFLWALPLAK
jgi:hypothetical protein